MTADLLALLLALPVVGFVALGLFLSVGRRPREEWVNRASACIMGAHLAISTLLCVFLFFSGETLHWKLGTWFQGERHPFFIELFLDSVAAPLLWASSAICAIVGFFSSRYLHRDPGFHRYFLSFWLFVASVSLVFLAANLDLVLVGWELVGLTSVLLIGFFQFRTAPVQGSLYALITYRICDFALTAGILLSHPWAHLHFLGLELSELGRLPQSAPSDLTPLALLLVLGCMGKSAQLPFSSWLSRAMEGPTPSSAVFYGAVSAHLGAFLLLRLTPLWGHCPGIPSFVVGVGLTTALYGAFVGRTRADAKSQLAFAAMAQLGFIFAEIGMGWETLALVHMVSHSFLRTLQFLKAPSAIHEFNKMGASGKRFLRNSFFFVESLIPERLQARMYRAGLLEGYLSGFAEALVGGFSRAVRRLDALETRWLTAFEMRRSK